jgi:predicted metal-dependent hydrolase
MKTEKTFIQFGQSEIRFSLEYSERKTLGIAVHPDQSIKVSAPFNADLHKIKEKVRNKAVWIIKQQNYFQSLKPFTPDRQYISGESHLYLGKQYKLKLVVSDCDEVKLSGGQLMTHVFNKTPEHVKSVLFDWYKDKAILHFNILFQECFDRFKRRTKYKGEVPSLVIKLMEKRWGSCTPGGKIILNTDLIRAPKTCIEYVIIHELCHLVYHDHSVKFYKLLSSIVPDWETRKDRLERALV